MEKNSNTNGMVDLFPTEITLDIFSRLPPETVLHCKLVCKSWRNLLRSCQYFPYMHLRRQELDDSKVSYILTCGFSGDGTGKFQLYYGEFTSSMLGLSPVVSIHHPCPRYNLILGSCNGLILCNPSHITSKHKTLYLSNPMTREYVNIPIQEDVGVCGFGYDISTSAYKIVRVDGCRDRVRGGANYKVHVYTIGSGIGWTRKENITPQLLSPRFGAFRGIPSNGALHWLDFENRIWAFDLADEEFRCIPSPQFHRASGDHFELRLLGGCLSMVHYKNSITIMDIWLLKKNNKKRKRDTSDGYTNPNEKLEYYQLSSWNWSKEFSLTEVVCQHRDPVITVDPFALTKNGELLLFSRTTTNIYVKSTRSIYDKEELNDGAHRKLHFYNAMPYQKSFVSLKDLGEDVRILDLGINFI